MNIVLLLHSITDNTDMLWLTNKLLTCFSHNHHAFRRVFCKSSLYQNSFVCQFKRNNHLFLPMPKWKSPCNVRTFQSSVILHSNKVNLNFVDRHGKTHQAEATIGDSLLDVVIENDLLFETYGVCEGTISCSTCHVILDADTYDKMEEPLMDEMDMLDLACGLAETSRLGCQVYVTKEMDGITVTLPREITDARDL